MRAAAFTPVLGGVARVSAPWHDHSVPDDELTIEELEAHFARAHDADGNDRWLVDETVRMTPDQLRAARDSIDRWVARARATLRGRQRDV